MAFGGNSRKFYGFPPRATLYSSIRRLGGFGVSRSLMRLGTTFKRRSPGPKSVPANTTGCQRRVSWRGRGGNLFSGCNSAFSRMSMMFPAWPWFGYWSINLKGGEGEIEKANRKIENWPVGKFSSFFFYFARPAFGFGYRHQTQVPLRKTPLKNPKPPK